MSSSKDIRKSSSFANPTKQIKGTIRATGLTRDFFTQLLKLEADFHNKQYTVATLDELIQIYARAVEHYDSIKDEISSYFIFKIQDILATKKSLKMLFEQTSKAGPRRPSEEDVEHKPVNGGSSENTVNHPKDDQKHVTIQENIAEASSEEEDEEEKLSEDAKRRRAKKVTRKERISISTLKNQKQRFVNLFYKMETQKANERENMLAVLSGFDNSVKTNDSFLQKDISTQKDRLRKRLDKRKLDSFMTQTINMSSFQGGVGFLSWEENQDKKENEPMFGSFLEELEGANGVEAKRYGDWKGSSSPSKSSNGPTKAGTPPFDEQEKSSDKGDSKVLSPIDLNKHDEDGPLKNEA